jgi:pyrroline-5-carboxylate reductase
MGGDLGWRRAVLDFFGRVGRVVELPEGLVDLAGGITGVGPAYLAVIAEAWVDAAIRRGMPPPQAAAMVTETLGGSAELLRHRRNDSLALRREVASPGGTTAAGLAELEANGVRTAFSRAFDAVLDSEK